MNGSIIEFSNVSYSFSENIVALDNVNLQIPKGKKVAVLGHNGAGKTTLFLHLNGIYRPNQGFIRISNEVIKYDRSYLREIRKKVGIVFQDPEQQLFSPNVFSDISYGLKNLRFTETLIHQKTIEVMQRLNIDHLSDRPIHQLSLGQKKLVALAGVLVLEPEILVLDEPTAYLDQRGTKEMINYLDTIQTPGRTIIISTHDLNFAYAWSYYIIIMKNGTVIGEGTTVDVFQNTELLNKADLKQPLLLEIYYELLQKKLIPQSVIPPNTKEQLIDIIRQGFND